MAKSTLSKITRELETIEAKWVDQEFIPVTPEIVAAMAEDISALIVLTKALKEDIRFLQATMMVDFEKKRMELKLAEKWLEVRKKRTQPSEL
jgi:hypothetical protein